MDAEEKWIVIGNQIGQARAVRHWSQKRAAAEVGVATGTWWGDENGRPISVERLQKYCDVFGWSMEKILAFLDSDAAPVVREQARLDFVSLVRATMPLARSVEERAILRDAAAKIVSSRWGVPADAFEGRVHPESEDGVVGVADEGGR